ncbi:HlyD family efflux transporter periplasmic adaptor subunit [Roseomonas sp. CCTCC AB2023176]|uniref:HlyD family efflux transporter periplasmic adaptor subunit n=1 Tax=Roseomonas sp. CCTCC AB2023176 TaxID=3342640 RepID=UPI0035D97878
MTPDTVPTGGSGPDPVAPLTGEAADAALDRLGLDYRSALDSMTDGVVTVGPDGRITAVNRAGAGMLGWDAEAAVGQTLQSVLSEEGTDAFLDAVLAPVGGESRGREVVDIAIGGRPRRLAVTSNAYRIRVGPQRGKLGLTATFADVTEVERLSAELSEQHRKLQSAYLELEASAQTLRNTTRRLAVVRIAATLVVFGLFAGAGLYAWAPSLDFTRSAAQVDTPTFGTIPVVPQPVSLTVAVVGQLDAGALVSIVAPFDGIVKERLFQYGNQVERGAPLLRLDRAEVEVRLRDARSGEIRARQRVEELRGWANGAEVSRARRQVVAAEMEGNDLRTRVTQTQMLLSRGIVAAEEMRTLQQQQRNQQLQLQAARQDLDQTIARGDAEHLRIAELELANAEVKVRDLESDLTRAEITAPVTGVILFPPEAQGTGRRETVEVGSRVSRGQAMFTIGNLESFLVRANVDEIDVARVRVGQPVRVSGDAFAGLDLRGRVSSVAAQATSGQQGRGGMATFAVTVAVDGLSPEDRAKLAVGMSASMSIIAYENAQAIVLPPPPSSRRARAGRCGCGKRWGPSGRSP